MCLCVCGGGGERIFVLIERLKVNCFVLLLSKNILGSSLFAVVSVFGVTQCYTVVYVLYYLLLLVRELVPLGQKERG